MCVHYFTDMKTNISSKLEFLSRVSLKMTVFLHAFFSLLSMDENSMFLSKMAGFNQTLSVIFLVLFSFVKLSIVVGISVPILTERPSVGASLYIALACVLIVEAMIAFASDDQSARTTAVLLALTASKHAVGTACARRFRTFGDIGHEKQLTEQIAYSIRIRASRYKLAPTSCFIIVGILIYTIFKSENPSPFSRKSQLSRVLGRAAYARAAAAIGFFSAIGAEDKTFEKGRKKDF